MESTMDTSAMPCVNCSLSMDNFLSEYPDNDTNNSFYYGPRSGQTLQTVGMILHRYVTPTDVFVGLVANIVSILVFAGKELRKLSSSVYVLSVLSADTGLLLTMLFVWLETLGYTIYHRTGLCQFYVYFQFVCSFLSVWYMVCITVENYITICHPLKIRVFCTLGRARIVVLSLLGASLLIYLFSVFSSHVAVDFNTMRPQCQTKPDWHDFEPIVTYLDTVITLLLPSLAILFMLVAIMVAIVTSLRKKKKRTVKENKRKTSCPQVRVAKMLFALSLTYLLLNIPSHIIRLYYLMRRVTVGQSMEITFIQAFILLIFQHISYINFYIKFFLFFAFSANFRKGVLGGCCRLFPRCQVYTPVAQATEGTRV